MLAAKEGHDHNSGAMHRRALNQLSWMCLLVMICERLSLPRVNKKIKGYIQVTQERFSYLHFILLINEVFLPYFFLLTQTAAYARGITGDGVRNIGHIQIYVSSLALNWHTCICFFTHTSHTAILYCHNLHFCQSMKVVKKTKAFDWSSVRDHWIWQSN